MNNQADLAHQRALVIQERVFLICTGIFIASLVTCNLIFQKFFEWTPFGIYTFRLSVGILPYPITFLVTDIISEIYGKKRADQIVVTGFVSSLFVMSIILIAQAVPQMENSPVSDEMFNKVFGLYGPAVFASMTAYLTAQFIDIRIFHFWKRLTKGKHLWLRNNGSTIVSQFVDTNAVIFLLCLLTKEMVWEDYWGLVISGFVFKSLVALFDTPLFYLLNWYLRKLMHLEPHVEIAEQRMLA